MHDAENHRNVLKSWLFVLSVGLGAFVVVTSEFLPVGLLTQISDRQPPSRDSALVEVGDQ